MRFAFVNRIIILNLNDTFTNAPSREKVRSFSMEPFDPAVFKEEIIIHDTAEWFVQINYKFCQRQSGIRRGKGEVLVP